MSPSKRQVLPAGCLRAHVKRGKHCKHDGHASHHETVTRCKWIAQPNVRESFIRANLCGFSNLSCIVCPILIRTLQERGLCAHQWSDCLLLLRCWLEAAAPTMAAEAGFRV